MKNIYKIIISLVIFVAFCSLIVLSSNRFTLVSSKDVDFTTDKVHLDINKQVIPWGFEALNLPVQEKTGSKIKVAILDSGIYIDHEDLNNKVIKEYNAINNQASPVDDFGHGTAIAGIITANNNNVGIVGVTQQVELYSVKVIPENGRVSSKYFVDGLEWAISEKVDIINISLGFQNDEPEIKRLIDSATDQGIVVIAASGNTYGLNSEYPARYSNVLSIGMLDKNMKATKLNAKGKIDFVAPGIEVLSTNNDGEYSLFDGTSFSAAYITGIVSRILIEEGWSADIYRNEKVLNRLIDLCLPLGEKDTYGYGIPVWLD